MIPPATCPAATVVDGVAPGFGGIVCGAMALDYTSVDSILDGVERGVFLAQKTDPSAPGLCCGNGMPSLFPSQKDDLFVTAAEEGVAIPGHFTLCPVWAAECERRWAGEDTLGLERPELPSVAPPDPMALVGAAEFDPEEAIAWTVDD